MNANHLMPTTPRKGIDGYQGFCQCFSSMLVRMISRINPVLPHA
jgi:hypothetical protein